MLSHRDRPRPSRSLRDVRAVVRGKGSKLRRQREDTMKVVNRQYPCHALFDPSGLRERLALRTMPVTAPRRGGQRPAPYASMPMARYLSVGRDRRGGPSTTITCATTRRDARRSCNAELPRSGLRSTAYRQAGLASVESVQTGKVRQPPARVAWVERSPHRTIKKRSRR
jgi:hypothetical protein